MDVFRSYLLYSNHGGRNPVVHFEHQKSEIDVAIVPRLFEFDVMPKLIPCYGKFLLSFYHLFFWETIKLHIFEFFFSVNILTRFYLTRIHFCDLRYVTLKLPRRNCLNMAAFGMCAKYICKIHDFFT